MSTHQTKRKKISEENTTIDNLDKMLSCLVDKKKKSDVEPKANNPVKEKESEIKLSLDSPRNV